MIFWSQKNTKIIFHWLMVQTIFLLIIGTGFVVADDKPTVELRVSTKTKYFSEKDKIVMSDGETLQLRVEKVTKKGKVIDITSDPKTAYFPLMMGVLQISNNGLVTVKRGKASKTSSSTKKESKLVGVMITYGNRGDSEVGIAQLLFTINGDI